MKRVNIKDAFVGEPASSQEGVEADDSDEAIVLAVRGGELVVVVPAGTPEESRRHLSRAETMFAEMGMDPRPRQTLRLVSRRG